MDSPTLNSKLFQHFGQSREFILMLKFSLFLINRLYILGGGGQQTGSKDRLSTSPNPHQCNVKSKGK